MLDLLFALVPALVVPIVLVVYRRDRALVARRLREAAAAVEGKVTAGRWPYHAWMSFEVDGQEAFVGCRYGTRGGDRAACTFAWLPCDDYAPGTLHLQRRPAREGLLEQLGRTPAATGHGEFDRAFFLSGDAPAGLLDHAVREALLDVDPAAGLQVRVGDTPALRPWEAGFGENERRLEVVVRGVPPKAEDLAQVLDVTRLLHERLRATDVLSAA